LKKIKPSHCKECKRTHEHQNPYIVVKKKDSIYHFEFFCGRSSHWQFFEIPNEEYKDNEFETERINIKDLVENDTIKFSNKNKELNNEIYTKKYQELLNTSDNYSKPNVTSEQNTSDYYKMFEVEIILESGWKNDIMKLFIQNN
jgi:hypothetical protein